MHLSCNYTVDFPLPHKPSQTTKPVSNLTHIAPQQQQKCFAVQHKDHKVHCKEQYFYVSIVVKDT